MWSRHEILRALPLAAAGPSRRLQAQMSAQLNYRLLGRTGRRVTPLGLGGMAALWWTPPGRDPADIILRAVELGITSEAIRMEASELLPRDLGG